MSLHLRSRFKAETRGFPHLDYMLLFGNGLVGHSEAQRVLQILHQQQITALQMEEQTETNVRNPEGQSIAVAMSLCFLGGRMCVCCDAGVQTQPTTASNVLLLTKICVL